MEDSSVQKTGEQHVSMFVSHKVASHRRAAARIKAILESRTERLNVHICERIPAGDEWLEWIKKHIARSSILLVLVPRKATDLTWIGNEIGRFESSCPDGRLVVLKAASDPVPDIVKDRQTIDATMPQLLEHFLEPLYRQRSFTRLDAPLNPRITDTDLRRDAQEIEDALSGIVDASTQFFSESFTVETAEIDLRTAESIGNAMVHAPNLCQQILDWNKRHFSWSELRRRAEEDKGKGTFWVAEMEEVILDVANQSFPSIMTSTFRGRGALGKIFQPKLKRVEFVTEKPVRFHFEFNEVLVPELVRGRGPIGEVFNLLRIAARIRWEVLDPFVVKKWLTRDTRIGITEAEQHDLIGKISGSLRVIQLEAERHQMFAEPMSAFEGAELKLVSQMLAEREAIKRAIDAAINQQNFEQLMQELVGGLEFNSRMMELLTEKFLGLVRKDRADVQDLVSQEVATHSTKSAATP